MKIKQIIFFLLIFALFCIGSYPVAAQSDPDTSEEPYGGDVLCLPGVYLNSPQDCLPLGPSAAMTEYARLGIQFPIPPLPSQQPSNILAEIPYQYIRLTYKGSVPVFNSLDDAIGKNVQRQIPFGFRYLSYTDRQERMEGIYYLFKTGEWVEGSYVSRVSPPFFQGYTFQNTPEKAFGWILDIVEPKKTPDTASEGSGKQLNRLERVYVYNSVNIEGIDWYLVGVNQWVEKKFVSVVQPNPTPPTGVENGRWIELNLYQQTLMVYDQGQMVFATMVSSGVEPFYTRPGVFQIYQKLLTETMSSGDLSDYYFLEDVPYTMYFDQARAIHGAYWHSLFGYQRSHGCVNLSIADSRWIYDWAEEGDWVYVWDPSGETPTDDAYYNENAGGP
jgi:hypothetical protein